MKTHLVAALILVLAAPALAQEHKIYKDQPIGDGDPRATSCYPEPSSQSRVKRLDCRTNAEWAQLAADQKRNGALDLGNKAGGAPVNIMH